MIPIGRMVLLADTAQTRTTTLAAIMAPMTPITVRALRSASFLIKPVFLRTAITPAPILPIAAPSENVAYASDVRASHRTIRVQSESLLRQVSDVSSGYSYPPVERDAAVSLRRVPAQILQSPADLSTAPTQESRVKSILAWAVQSMGADGGAVVLCRDGTFQCRVSHGESIPPPGTVLRTDTGLTGACLRTGQLQLCVDVDRDPRVDRAACVQLGIRSFVAVPLTRPDQQVIGLLELVFKDAHALKLEQPSDLYEITEKIVGSICPAPAPETVLESGPGLPLLGSEAITPSGEPDAAREEDLPELDAPCVHFVQQKESRFQRLSTAVALVLVVATGGYGASHLIHWPRSAPRPSLAASHASHAGAVIASGARFTQQPIGQRSRNLGAMQVINADYTQVAASLKGYISADDFNVVQLKARAGDPKAEYEMGLRYANGLGVAQDWEKAMSWFERAANRDIASAQWKLGLGYVRGIGLERNNAKAALCFKRAANQGHIGAQRALGDLYLSGVGVRQDYLRAYVWYAIADGVFQSPANGTGREDLDAIAAQLTPPQIQDANRRLSNWWTRRRRNDRG